MKLPIDLSAVAFASIMVLNAIWFGMAFHYFSIKAASAARMLVPRDQRTSPLFGTLTYALRFLGGMNAALALMSLTMLAIFEGLTPVQRATLTAVLAVAHASQFAFNVPIALGRMRQPGADRGGVAGPMRLIFAVDGILMIANAFLALRFFLA